MRLIDLERFDGAVFSGGWHKGRGGTITDIAPATGQTLVETGQANAEEVGEAAERAKAAQRGWAATSFEHRAEILRRAVGLLDEHTDELQQWIVQEAGKIPPAAGKEIAIARGELNEAIALTSQPSGDVLPSEQPERLSMIRRIPVGVVGVISPWNFPLNLSMRSVAPALALGNAVVLKPDPNTPVAGGLVIARLLEEAGLPDDVLHVLPGDAEAGQALCTDPRVGMISFTGSTDVGRVIADQAGRTLKRVALELGGNNALIVLDDADVDLATSAGAWGSFLHQGQICMTAGRHLVHEKVFDQYVERLGERAGKLRVGDPASEQVALGPLINDQQVQRVAEIVDGTVGQGARVVTGGTHHDRFFAPTVLAGVTPDMPAFADEIFGPVAPVVSFGDEDEAVDLANRVEHGLVAAIQTSRPNRGMRLGERLEAGMIHINDQTVNDEPHVPFGGIGASGNGFRFGGLANLEAFTFSQWVTVRDEPASYPF